MTCEHCQEFISAFLDNELDETIASNVRTHLAVCAPCAKVCEDFAMILDFCQIDEFEDSLPPNPKALWCRINNLIETEIDPEIIDVKPPEPQIQQSWFARFWSNSWQMSFSQLAVSVLGIAVISSVLTVVGIKNYNARAESASVSAAPEAPNLFERVLGKLGLVETAQQARERRIKEQQMAIDYWKKRVEQRRVQWNAHLREVFDRNLNELNQVVNEYDRILQENPQDEISGEMLDSALNEQMALLREFSEL